MLPAHYNGFTDSSKLQWCVELQGNCSPRCDLVEHIPDLCSAPGLVVACQPFIPLCAYRQQKEQTWFIVSDARAKANMQVAQMNALRVL
eukprot:6185786-Pleurochrysis_carterae.AAC.2